MVAGIAACMYMSIPVLQACPLLSSKCPWQRWAAAHNIAVGKIVRSSWKAMCFALSVRLCAHIGKAMSKCSMQEFQTTAKRRHVATLLACFEAGGSDTNLTWLPHRSPSSLPDDLTAMRECVSSVAGGCRA